MGVVLACLLAFGLLTLWVPERWAVSAVQIGIYALAGYWLVVAAVRDFPPRSHPLMIPLAGAALWGCVQLAAGTTIYRWATEVAVLDWFTRLAVFFTAWQLFAAMEERDRARVARWLLWFGFAMATLAILQKYTSPDRIFWLFATEPGNVMGPFEYHNQYAVFIETVLPLALVVALRRGPDRWFATLAAGVMTASVVAAQSRAGIALVLAESAVVLLLLKRRGRPIRSAAAAVLALAAVFTLAVGYQPLRRKFDRSDQLAERRLLYLSTIEMAKDHPALGTGLGTWAIAYPAYARFDDGRRDNQAHNDWLQWTAEGGLPMLALMLGIPLLLVRPALRTVWGVGLLAVLAHCLVDYPFGQRPALGYYYFALAALVCAFAAENDGHGAREDVQLEPD